MIYSGILWLGGIVFIGIIALIGWGVYHATKDEGTEHMDGDASKPRSGPKEFFMNILMFGLLYVFSISFVSLWWQYINKWFPDPLLSRYSLGFESIRWQMSLLIVVFPIYTILARMSTKAIVADPARKDLRIYRWLVYFTLFLSGVTAIVDLITLLNGFLGGDLTTSFALKVVVVLVVSLGVFGYYLWHLRSDVSQTASPRRALLWGSVVLVIGSIVLGFVIMGSPMSQRKMRFDMERVNNLQNLQSGIEYYFQAHQKLPATLGDIGPQSSYTAVDPKTKQSYLYHQLAPLKYELCATFETDSNSTYEYNSDMWQHGVGQTCFSRTIDPAYFPKPVQPVPLR